MFCSCFAHVELVGGVSTVKRQRFDCQIQIPTRIGCSLHAVQYERIFVTGPQMGTVSANGSTTVFLDQMANMQVSTAVYIQGVSHGTPVWHGEISLEREKNVAIQSTLYVLTQKIVHESISRLRWGCRWTQSCSMRLPFRDSERPRDTFEEGEGRCRLRQCEPTASLRLCDPEARA